MTVTLTRRGQLLATLWFGAGNTLLLLVNAAGYLPSAPEAGMLGWTFVRAALLAQVSAAGFLLSLLVAGMVAALGPWRARLVAPPLGALIFLAAELFLLFDRKTYALFKFHFNGLALNVITSPGGWESVHVSGSDLALVGGTLALLLGLEIGTFVWLLRRFGETPPAVRVFRRWLVFAVPVLLLGVGERVIYAWADLNNVREVTRSAKLVPLYQPFTIKRFARKYFHVKIDEDVRLASSKGVGNLNYPRAALTGSAPAKLPNIVWLTLDSWRSDAFTPELSPRIDQFSRKATVFENHLSGGNSTRYGVFSMFYGLHGSYWQTVLADRRGPVLISRLQELGYRTDILASTSLTWPEFRRTAFVDIPASVEDAMPGPRTKDKDRQLTEHLSAFLDRDPGKPFFAWLFFDSTHAPYDFEEKEARITPYATSMSMTNLDGLRTDVPARTATFNRYKNAVAYLDRLCGQVIDDLQRRGLLENTIVVITGDHGEEYFEHGYFGHNGAFTPEQIHVPMVYFDPAREPAHLTRLTAHQDLVPTTLERLGVTNPPADYSLGMSLFGAETHPFVVSCAWAECAVVDSRGWLVFGTEGYNATGVEVLGSDYREVADPRAVLNADGPELVGVMGQMSAFLR